LADGFHIYAAEWEPDEIRWYFDDTNYFTATATNVTGEWVFDHSFYFVLNIAVGGNWPGPPDGTTVFPQQMLVDYVRVYSRASAPSFSLNAVLVGSQIQISFPTQTGLDYQVGYKTDLNEPAWTPIETILGDGTKKTVAYPTSDPNQAIRFYIVQAL
jgi:beta-glucanase (GH16 family)